MASTPPHCSITASKPYQTHQYPQNHRHTRPTTHHVSLSKPPLPSSFSGRRSTRLVSKMHLGRPRTSVGSRHSPLAEEALEAAVRFGKDDFTLDDILHSFESRLASDDYTFLLRELGNRGESAKAVRCFEFAVRRERRRTEQGKLASSIISTLGRLGKVELAKNVFRNAVNEGYGRTVYTYSALISAYGRSGYCHEAIKVLQSMKDSGLRPNLVTYNSVIDACGKGGVEFKKVVGIFDEMLNAGVQPDRITYNSLLAVCSRGGLWEAARSLFTEMVDRGIDQDIYTYNTLLDAVSKGGQMDLAYQIMSEMPSKNILPNVVTYSTMIDGYAKAGRLEDALSLFNEMKFLAIGLDRVLYNTLLSLYGNLGRFEEALNVCKEMENVGILKDVVSYNALLGGYGKQGKYNEVRELYDEMKAERVSPNLLTYSTLIDVYSKGGLYAEAVNVFKEFKQAGLKADVVLYSELINALCKNGLVESAVSLLDEMTKEGIRPNVVTYNSIIDAFGRPATTECVVDAGTRGFVLHGESSTSLFATQFDISADNVQNLVRDREDTRIMKMFGRLAADKAGYAKKDMKIRQEILCILGVFQKMHELDIKPNVVTFSAILNACSRCNSFEDASMLLEELRLFDNQVYGVAHGLLMGYRGNVWVKAQSLFDEVKQMDCSTASAFYNALTDMLWHFGQKKGAQLVVLEGKRRNVWENAWSNSRLDLHLMSSGAARAMVHAWLLNIHSIVYQGQQLPNLLSILTGWGKHSKVVGDSALRRAVEALLTSMGAPFRVHECNIGRFISSGSVAAAWLKESGTLEVLMLHDDRAEPTGANFGQISKLQALTL